MNNSDVKRIDDAIRTVGEPAIAVRASVYDSEIQFRMVLEVFREYLLDLDHDIEGCDVDELQDIESQIGAAKRLRARIVAHVCEGKGPRGC